jgi:hypothetical protein
MTHHDDDDGLTDPVHSGDTDETDRAYDRWLDEKLGVPQ